MEFLNKRKFLLFTFIFLLIAVVLGNMYLSDYKRVGKNFNLIRIGDTKFEVILLVGLPVDKYHWAPPITSPVETIVATEERWILNHSPNAQKLPSCIFSEFTDKVIRVEMVDTDYLF